MSKIITYSNWNATDVPDGLTFDKDLGVFSGTPNVPVGEYVVPVSVSTNYGSDNKDVKIIIARSDVFQVYAIGERATTWSNNATPDSLGFYPIPIPKAYKLIPVYGGFGARTPDDKCYYCGTNNITAESYSFHNNKNYCANTGHQDPTRTPIDGLEKIQMGIAQRKGGTGFSAGTPYYSEVTYCLCKYSSGKVTLSYNSASGYVKTATVNTYSVGESGKSAKQIVSQNGDIGENLFDFVNCDTYRGVPFLSNNGTYVGTSTISNLGGSGNYYERDLDFKAIKRFSNVALSLYDSMASSAANQMSLQSPVFTFLTEDKLLDNDPNNFTFGDIRDAWVIGNTAYVATEDNKLYNYDKNYVSWNLIGNYDVKKIEFPPLPFITFAELKAGCSTMPANIFMLTNDGKLYHKGVAVEGLFEQHNEFTQIYPECYIHDMTFGVNTLTVLR